MPDNLTPPEPAGSPGTSPEPEPLARTAERVAAPPVQLDAVPESADVDEQSEQSFPASDAPSWSGVSI